MISLPELPKLTVSDYPEMLNKLAWFFGTFATIQVYIFRYTIPDLAKIVESLSRALPDQLIVYGITPIDLVPIIVGVVLGVFTRAVKLHDLISDIFSIRMNFDICYIILPMAALCGAQLTPLQLERLPHSRNSLMSKIFYRYASSTSSDTIVSDHDLKQALTNWSWYWVVVELGVLVVATVAIYWVFGAIEYIPYYIMLLFILAMLGMHLRNGCIKYAHSQIKTIINDQERSGEVLAAFADV